MEKEDLYKLLTPEQRRHADVINRLDKIVEILDTRLCDHSFAYTLQGEPEFMVCIKCDEKRRKDTTIGECH